MVMEGVRLNQRLKLKLMLMPVLDHMDMKLIMTTKNGLQNQDMDMEVTAMCIEQQKV